MDGGAWWATVHGVAKNRTRLSDLTFSFFHFQKERSMMMKGIVKTFSGAESRGQHDTAFYEKKGQTPPSSNSKEVFCF